MSYMDTFIWLCICFFIYTYDLEHFIFMACLLQYLLHGWTQHCGNELDKSEDVQ